ncbi:MAG TPA: hypothetical protein VL356_08460 [Acidocella sp.]|jgi:hypothetical protein|nr:hypothetical protein [Acidocella sp.]
MRFKALSVGLSLGACLAVQPAQGASPAVSAAETSVRLSVGVMHTQYHEHVVPGDDESGAIPGFGVSVSALLPARSGDTSSVDIYSALIYNFDAGNSGYSGHYLFSGAPASATDHAVFNRVEARLGLGFPMIGGMESIPFLAAGYQAWNRNISSAAGPGADESYHSGLFGLGYKLDVPIGFGFVASGTGELLGLAGGGITDNGNNWSGGFGVTPEERVELGLDHAVFGRFHVFATAYWQHFNYSGTPPESFGYSYDVYEPFSTTTQFGANFGIGYSFN